MKRRNRSLWQNLLSSPFFLVASIIILILLTRAVLNIHEKAIESDVRLRETQAELAKLQADESALTTEVSSLSTPAGIRDEIKERYHAVDPGESVAVIVTNSSGIASSSAETAEASSSPTWWSRMIHFFGL